MTVILMLIYCLTRKKLQVVVIAMTVILMLIYCLTRTKVTIVLKKSIVTANLTKTNLSFDSSPENLESETNITISTDSTH